MDKDGGLVPRKDQVRPPGEPSRVKAKPEASSVKRPPQHPLRGSVTTADPRHHARACLLVDDVGQTTASILYAQDRNKADLAPVFVQMKLSVVETDRIDDVVPLISRYANTQNRISEADFFSSHPFHV